MSMDNDLSSVPGDIEAEANGKYERAVMDFDEAIELNPNDAQNFGKRGLLNRFLGHIELAMSDLNRAIELDSTVPESFLGRGQLYAASGDYRRAIADYDAAICLNEFDYGSYTVRGTAYTELGDFRRAISDDKALAITPDSLWAYWSRATAHYLARDPLSAIRDLNEVAGLDPEEYQALAYASAGKDQEAQRDAATAIALGLDKEFLDAMMEDARKRPQ